MREDCGHACTIKYYNHKIQSGTSKTVQLSQDEKTLGSQLKDKDVGESSSHANDITILIDNNNAAQRAAAKHHRRVFH